MCTLDTDGCSECVCDVLIMGVHYIHMENIQFICNVCMYNNVILVTIVSLYICANCCLYIHTNPSLMYWYIFFFTTGPVCLHTLCSL